MQGTNFRKLVHQRFDAICSGKLDQDAVTGIIAFTEGAGKEQDVIEFLESNKDATLQETLEYVLSDQTEEMEIVDDDELDDDWEDDE